MIYLRRFIKSLFYIPKHAKPKDENIMRMIMPSVIGIILCMSVLAGLTWAWFTANISAQNQTLTSANFAVEVKVLNGTNEVADSQGRFELKADEQYSVTINPAGSASAGYCELEFGGQKYYTSQIGESGLSFTYVPDKDTVLSYIPVWGRQSRQPDIENGDNIGITVHQAASAEQLENTIDNAQSGDMILVTDDITLAADKNIWVLDKSLTIDLGENVLTMDGQGVFNISNYSAAEKITVEIKNGSIRSGENANCAVDLYGDVSHPLKVIISGTTITAGNGAQNAIVFNNCGQSDGGLVLNNANVTGKISVTDGQLEINGGTYAAREDDDCIVSSNFGGMIKGGTFTATGDKPIFIINKNDTFDFVIDDGVFEYESAYAVLGSMNNPNRYIQINGGVFNGADYQDDMFDLVVAVK